MPQCIERGVEYAKHFSDGTPSARSRPNSVPLVDINHFSIEKTFSRSFAFTLFVLIAFSWKISDVISMMKEKPSIL